MSTESCGGSDLVAQFGFRGSHPPKPGRVGQPTFFAHAVAELMIVGGEVCSTGTATTREQAQNQRSREARFPPARPFSAWKCRVRSRRPGAQRQEQPAA